MDPEQLKENFSSNTSIIVEKLAKSEQTTDMLYALFEQNLIDEEQYEKICVHCVTHTSKAFHIIQLLQDDIQAIRKFLNACLQLNLIELAQILSPPSLKHREFSNLTEVPFNRSTSSLPELNAPSPVDGYAIAPSQTFPGDLSKESNGVFHVVPCQVPYGLDNSDEVYKNLSTPRGAVLVINFETFHNNALQTRKGSQVDVERLENLFVQIGYNVDLAQENMTKAEMVKKIHQFKADPSLGSMDSCVIVIMSHGVDDSYFVTSDNKRISYSEVIELFNNQHCPLLQSKPKIFIFQCCRGSMFDFGVDLMPQKVLEISNRIGSTQISELDPQSDAAYNGRQGILLERSPSFSDMFVILSTVAGFTSFRSVENGSWLIEAICLEFMEHAHNTDLEGLMKKVSRRLKTQYSANGRKQICELRNIGFDKHFYFNPISSSGLSAWDGCTYPTLPHISRNRRHQSGSNSPDPTSLMNSHPHSPMGTVETVELQSTSVAVQTAPCGVNHDNYPRGKGSAEDYLKFARHISSQNSYRASHLLKRQLSHASDSEADQQMISLLQYFRVNDRPDLADVIETIQHDFRKERKQKKQKCSSSLEL